MGSFNNIASGSTTWTVPATVAPGTTVLIEMWGAGGGGGGCGATANNTNGGGGGAGGGAYAKIQVTGLVAGNTMAYTVGARGTASVAADGVDGGASQFNNNSGGNTSTIIGANGGIKGLRSGQNGLGGAANGSGGGITSYGGGKGNNQNAAYGGGGGGASAGNANTGADATSRTGATAVNSGGSGGSGGTRNANGSNGVDPGGGGGGSGANNATTRRGGYGGNGSIRLSWTDYDPSVVKFRSKTHLNTSSTTCDPGEPAGAAENDILLLWVASAYDLTGTPTGWTLLYHTNFTSGNHTHFFWIRRGASAPVTEVAQGSSDYIEASITCWQYCATTGNPYSAVTNGTAVQLNPCDADPPSVNTTVNDTTVVALGMAWSDTTTGFTAPSGYTIREAGASGDDLMVASKYVASAGAEDPGSFSGGKATLNWTHAVTIALQGEQGTTLTVSECSHGHSTDAIALTQVHTLAVQESGHGLTNDAVALTQVHTLVVQESSHAHASDPVNLNVNLVVQESVHAHSTDPVTLTQVHTLAVQESIHSHTTDPVTVTTSGGADTQLIVSECGHGHSADIPTLTQAHTVAVQDSTHGHGTDAIALTQAHTLAVQDSAHAHTVDVLDLSQAHVLAVSECGHGMYADAVDLLQAHTVTVSECLHSHAAEVPTLTVFGGDTALFVMDAIHGPTPLIMASTGKLLKMITPTFYLEL